MAIDVEQLRKGDFVKQLSFAFLTCERLFPNYVFFSQNYNFGNPNDLRNALDYIHENLLQQNFSKKEITAFIIKVEDNTPEPGDFDTIRASSALDSCTAILESLHFILDKKFKRIEDISTFATDSVHMYIHDKEDLDFNTDKSFFEKIDNHPLMIKEVKIQNQIIQTLLSREKIDTDDIKNLLILQDEKGKGNLIL